MVSHRPRSGHTQTRKVGEDPGQRIALERHGDRLLILVRREQQRAFMISFPEETRVLAALLQAELDQPGVTR